MPDTLAPEYNLPIDRAAEHLIPRVVKRNIYDSGNTDNYLAVSGDKYFVGKLPNNCRPFFFWMSTLNLDTNAVPTLAVKLCVGDGTTTHTFIATAIVGTSGAYQFRIVDSGSLGDMLDNSTDADWDIWLESTASGATVTSTGAEIAVGWAYFMDRGGSDPA